MNIFDLHAAMLGDYRDFVRSYFTIADERARAYVNLALDEEARLWPDFLLQVSPSYLRTATVDALAQQGALGNGIVRAIGADDLIDQPARPKEGTPALLRGSCAR